MLVMCCVLDPAVSMHAWGGVALDAYARWHKTPAWLGCFQHLTWPSCLGTPACMACPARGSPAFKLNALADLGCWLVLNALGCVLDSEVSQGPKAHWEGREACGSL